MRRRLLLVAACWAVGAGADPAAPLPPRGYVNLDALVHQLSPPAAASRLSGSADALRQAAAADQPAVLVEPPADVRATAPSTSGPLNGEFESKADELDLSLLGRAVQDQVLRNRSRELVVQSADLADELQVTLAESRAERLAWERSLALLERYERINLIVALAEPGMPPARADRLRRDLNTLDAATAAVAGARAREIARREVRLTRDAVTQLQRELDTRALDDQRAGERLLAARELELADQRQLREAYRKEQVARHGTMDIDVRLDYWRDALHQRPAAAAARGRAVQDSARATAQTLDQTAAALAGRQPATRRAAVLAWLRVVSRRDHVDLLLAPADDVPEVTLAVAARIRQLSADPIGLTPLEEVPAP